MLVPISRFYNPVRLVLGEGCFASLGAEAAKLGRRPLVVTGQGALRREGVLTRALDLLYLQGMQPVVWEGAIPNPTDASCEEAGAQAREEQCDLVIGLGGGSAMDTAKGAAIYATQGVPLAAYLVADTNGQKVKPTAATLPIVCVTSTAGTSTQLTPFAVITAVAARVKTGIPGDALFPRVSLCDPELTYTVPPRVTAATGIDVLCHSVEAYFSCGASPVTDLAAERAVALVAQHLPRAVADGSDREARGALSQADVFSGFALSNCGGTIIHAIEHPLSAHYPDLPHGEGLAALLPAWAFLFHAEAPERFARLAACLGVDTGELSAERAAAQVEPALRGLLEEVGLGLTLTDLGVAPETLPRVAQDVLVHNRGTLDRMPLRVDESHVLAMLERSL